MFPASAARHLSAMRQALAEGAPRALEEAAHALKGSAGNLGAAQLAYECAALEILARRGNLDLCEPGLKAVEREVGAAIQELAALATEPTAPNIEWKRSV
jgi:two-component system sensor histidine kinase/response regulator